MNRIDILTQLAIEGALSPEEETELETLLKGDATARDRYQELIDVEIALRGLDGRLDVSDAVMTRLGVKASPAMAVLPAPVSTAWEEPDGINGKVERWTLRLVVPATLAAAITLVFALIHSRDRFEVPTFTASGEVAVMREGKPVASPAKEGLRAGDRVVVSPGAASELSFDDSTLIALTGGTELRVKAPTERAGERSKSFELIAGTLTAEVASQPERQPLVVRTPHAEAVVRGTRFTLVSGKDRSRLEVSEGRVDFFAVGAGEPAVVVAGYFAETGSPGGAAETTTPVVRPLRSREGLLALYSFDEGAGDVVRDQSERGKALDLHLTGKDADPLQWLPGGGIRFGERGYLVSRESASKITSACRASGAITVEAWVEPASEAAGPARIVTLSRTSQQLNFLLGQGKVQGDPEQQFVGRLRSSTDVDDFLAPAGSAAGGLVHLVMTREKGGLERLWIDGNPVAVRDEGGSLETWIDGLPLAIGDDAGGENRTWRGACHFVAIYDRPLTSEEIAALHAWGVP